MEVIVDLQRTDTEVIFFFSSSQLLYSTYLLSSARKSIGVDEEMRREVYDRMMPAFEELFDKVEEHTLNILLEPWMLLVHRDRQSFQKVITVHHCICRMFSFTKSTADLQKQSQMWEKIFEIFHQNQQ